MTSDISYATPLYVQAANILRTKILRGDFALGERINEVETANSLGISRSPLREGLQTLAQEGLVRVVNGKGFFVASFDPDEIRELLELRQALDVLAIQLAAQRATPADLALLERSMEDLTASHEPGDHTVPWSSDFHIVIFTVAGNTKLREHGTEVHTQLRLARYKSGEAPERIGQAREEHAGILAALRDHDADEAERRVRIHHRNSTGHILLTLTGSRNAAPAQ